MLDAAAYQEALERSYQKHLRRYVQIEFMLIDNTLTTVRGWLTHITDAALYLEDLRIEKRRVWTFHPIPYLQPNHRRPDMPTAESARLRIQIWQDKQDTQDKKDESTS